MSSIFYARGQTTTSPVLLMENGKGVNNLVVLLAVE
jgi:hypothetical protein